MWISTRGRSREWALPALCLFGLGGVLLWTRLSGLQASFWRDEIYTVMHYAGPGPRGIWLGTYIPNDHVLFNLLAWMTASVFGASELAYRLPSVVPGIAATVLLTAWLWRRVGSWSAVALAALAVASPMNLELVKQARGYGLAFLAGALLLIGAAELALAADGEVRTPPRRALFLLGLVGLIGICTLTGFAFAFIGELIALGLLTRPRRRLILAAALVGLGSLAFYGPLLGPIASSLAHPGGFFDVHHDRRLAWDAFLLGPPDQFVAPFTSDLLRIHGLLPARILGLGLATAGGLRLWHQGRRRLLGALAIPPVLTELGLTVLRVHVNPRFLSFLLFHFIVLMAFGVVAAVEVAPRPPALRYALAALATILVALTGWRAVRVAEHWNGIPIENAKQVAAVVHAAGFDAVLTDSRKPQGLRWYLGRGNVTLLSKQRDPQRALCSARGPLAFVADLAYPAGFVDASCLADRGARLIVIPERGVPGRYDSIPLNVWLLGRAFGLELILPPSSATVTTVCGTAGDFPLHRAGARPLSVRGRLKVPAPTEWQVKLKLKRCLRGRFGEYAVLRGKPAAGGQFEIMLPPLPPGDYELRAGARPRRGGSATRATRILFAVGR